MSCNQYWNLSRLQKIKVRVKDTKLYVGGWVHKWLEEYRMHGNEEESFRAMEAEIHQAPAHLLDERDRFKFQQEAARARAMVSSYAKRYADQDAVQWTERKVEQKVEMDLFGIPFIGYIDCLQCDQAGNWWILETKTTALDLTASYWEKVAFDNQVMTYIYLAAKQLKVVPKGIIYDVVKKTRHRVNARENFQQFQRRMEKLYYDEMHDLYKQEEKLLERQNVKRWKQYTEYVMKTMEEQRRLAGTKEGFIFPRHTGNCESIYGLCKFFDVCSTGKIDAMRFDSPSSAKAN